MTMTISTSLKFHYRYNDSHLLWAGLFVLSLILQTFNWVDSWRFDRVLVEQGSYWLLLSGHVAHFNWVHWLLNMAGLAIVAFFFGPHASVKQWFAVMLCSMVLISSAIWLWLPDVRTYVGLSGVLHGLFLYGALREIRYYPVSGYVLLCVLIAKLAWEFFNGAMPGSEEMTGGRVLTESHLFGAIAGIIVWLYEYSYDLMKQKMRSE